MPRYLMAILALIACSCGPKVMVKDTIPILVSFAASTIRDPTFSLWRIPPVEVPEVRRQLEGLKNSQIEAFSHALKLIGSWPSGEPVIYLRIDSNHASGRIPPGAYLVMMAGKGNSRVALIEVKAGEEKCIVDF